MTEVDPSLIALETLDRTSPELWPEPSKQQYWFFGCRLFERLYFYVYF